MSAIPARGSVLGFDFGERYIGVAVGELETRFASPLETIEAESREARLARIAALVTEWRPARLVVGLPLTPEGAEHAMTARAKRFARQLEAHFRLPVEMADERFSSASAEEHLRVSGRGGRKHKSLAHPIAAQIILQAYFDELAAQA